MFRLENNCSQITIQFFKNNLKNDRFIFGNT